MNLVANNLPLIESVLKDDYFKKKAPTEEEAQLIHEASLNAKIQILKKTIRERFFNKKEINIEEIVDQLLIPKEEIISKRNMYRTAHQKSFEKVGSALGILLSNSFYDDSINKESVDEVKQEFKKALITIKEGLDAFDSMRSEK
jgi:hypothetical protein